MTAMEGHPTTQRWPPTIRKYTTDMEFGNYTLLMRLTPADDCNGGSPTIPRRVTHHKKMYCRHGIWQLHITNETSTRWQLPWWSLTIPRRVTCQPEDGHPPTNWWSPQLAQLGPVWHHLARVAHVWPHLTMFGTVHPCFPPLNPILACFTMFGPV